MKQYLTFALLGVVGFFIGTLVDGSSRFEAGKMAACHDMLGVMVIMSPELGAAQPQCAPYKGVTAIQIDAKFYSLDGRTKLN